MTTNNNKILKARQFEILTLAFVILTVLGAIATVKDPDWQNAVVTSLSGVLCAVCGYGAGYMSHYKGNQR